MQDPYAVLGLSRSATAEEVKRAYRGLAKKLHPDVNPDDPDVARRFQDVSAAYDVLRDKDRRAAYDRGEREGMPPHGANGGPGFRRAYADEGGFHFRRGPPPESDDLFEQIFGMFGQRARRDGAGPRPGSGQRAGAGRGGAEKTNGATSRPATVQLDAEVPFLVAIKGGTQRVHLPSGRDVDVRIPIGTEDGTQLRLPHQGQSGADGRAGDVIVTVAVEDHPVFRRDENDILTDLPVDLHQAVLGDRVTVPTIDGPVTMRVPPGSNTGTRLRLRGKGVPARRGIEAGDQYVTLRIVLTNPNDPLLTRFLRERREQPADAD